MNTKTAELWNENNTFTENTEFRAIIRSEPPIKREEIFMVEFYNTAASPYKLVERQFVESGNVVPKAELPERVATPA